jgi:hypothetical protein
MTIINFFVGNPEEKIEKRLAKDSDAISTDVAELGELTVGEVTYVKGIRRAYDALLKVVQQLQKDIQSLKEDHGKGADEDFIQEIVYGFKTIWDTKQHVIGSCDDIVKNGHEILRIQGDLVRLTTGFDKKLEQQSLLFIRDEQDLMNLGQDCMTKFSKIGDEANKRREMDIDDFSSGKLAVSIEACHNSIELIRACLGVIKVKLERIDSTVSDAVRQVTKIKTENVELNARFEYLLKIMENGVQHDFKLAPEHQAILDAERRKAS